MAIKKSRGPQEHQVRLTLPQRAQLLRDLDYWVQDDVLSEFLKEDVVVLTHKLSQSERLRYPSEWTIIYITRSEAVTLLRYFTDRASELYDDSYYNPYTYDNKEWETLIKRLRRIAGPEWTAIQEYQII